MKNILEGGGQSALPRLLLVEDVAALRRSFAEILSSRSVLVSASSVAEAIRLLNTFDPEILLIDVSLPDGTAFDILAEVAKLERAPTVIAMSGSAGPDEAFHLAQLGVRHYLPKPVTVDVLEAAFESALTTPPNLAPHLRASVGHRAVRDVEAEVRTVMVREALARSHGSRRGAAKLLSLSRQLLQHILRSEPQL